MSKYSSVVGMLLGILLQTGCGETVRHDEIGPVETSGPTLPQITAAQLRHALVGRYQNRPGPNASFSVSFRYPRFMRHADSQTSVGGDFEILDDHWALRNSGTYGTGTFALLTQSAFSDQTAVLLVRPAVNQNGGLDGLYVVGLFAEKLKPEQQFLIRYVGPPEIPEGERIQPLQIDVSKMPDFRPRSNDTDMFLPTLKPDSPE